MLEAAFAMLVSGTIVWLISRVDRQRLRRWEEAAVSCGLQIVERPGR